MYAYDFHCQSLINCIGPTYIYISVWIWEKLRPNRRSVFLIKPGPKIIILHSSKHKTGVSASLTLFPRHLRDE